MKKVLKVCLLVFTFFRLNAQTDLVPFGSTGWDYSYRLPVNEVCSTPTPSSGVEWKMSNYVKTSNQWTNVSNQLPIGYVNGSTSYGGIELKKDLLFNPSGNNPTTLYLRQTITLPNILSSYSYFTLKLKADDGVRVYFNGDIVANHKLQAGTIEANTSAFTVTTDVNNYTFNVPNTITNHHSDPYKITITAEVHQSTSGSTATSPGTAACLVTSSDLFFDMELTGTLGTLTPIITRGPYLQLPHPTGIQVRWRTSTTLVGRVCYGTSSGSLITCSTDLNAVLANDHIVILSGLIPNSTYFYSVQHTSGALTEGTVNHKFTTPPTNIDTSKTTRIWVTGDPSEEVSSSKIPRQDEVLKGFKTFQTNTPSAQNLDLWLLLGDNAYSLGTEAEYTTGFFTPYDDMNAAYPATNNNQIMKQTPIMPCVGNHDYYNGPNISNTDQTTIREINDFTSAVGSMNTFWVPDAGKALSNFRQNKQSAFYSIFSMPSNTNTNLLSNKYSSSPPLVNNGYYSYNHNNIHFICLDSYGFYNNHLLYAGIPSWPTLPTNNPQMAWLMNDLASNTQNWTIMYWHHAPYSKSGGHSSNKVSADEFILTGLREKLIKYLDSSGHKIDLVLNGHSHSYERSRLLKGHDGLEDTFRSSLHNNNNAANANHNGMFKSSTECPYLKSSTGVNEGIIYVVTGSSGQLQKSVDDVDFTVGHKALNGAYFRPDFIERVPSENFSTNGGLLVNRTTLSTIEDQKGGSFYIEVKDNRLDAKFINEDGEVGDKFTIIKDVKKVENKVDLILTTESPLSQTFSLPWPKTQIIKITGPSNFNQTYSLPSNITISYPQIGPIYTVTDSTTCLTQNIRFHFSPNCRSGGVTINNIIDSTEPEIIKSSSFINADNTTIKANKSVIFQAENAINLNPNTFKVENGAVFTARITNPCN